MSKADGKRILIFGGWFGSRNAGDEAILLGCKKVLERAIPGARIFAHSTDPAYTRDVCGVEPVFAPQDAHFLNKLRALVRAYRSMDLFLVSGGTPILDSRYAGRAFHFGVPLLFGVPMVFFGIGTKRIESRYGRWFYRTVLRRAKYISVRDPGVREYLAAMGIRAAMALTADSAICVDSEQGPAVERILVDAGLDPARPLVAICPIFLSDDPVRHYHDAIPGERRQNAYRCLAQLADHLIDSGRQVVFMAMHPLEPGDDHVAIREVRGQMRQSAPLLEPVDDPRRVAGLLGRMDMVVGMRLHAIVLASSRGVPVVAIDVEMKVRSYMEYLAMEGYCP
ncbi:MAG: polysaccharide pyruvyl transferase family protein, partial [Myxococcota bacterium]